MERKNVLTIQTPGKKHSVYLAACQHLRDVLHRLGLHGLSFPCGGNSVGGSAISDYVGLMVEIGLINETGGCCGNNQASG